MPLRIGRLKPSGVVVAAEDLFLGYWNSGGSDVVLRNNEGGVLGGGRADGSSGVWRVGDVTVSQAVANNAINAAQEQKLSTFGTHPSPATNHHQVLSGQANHLPPTTDLKEANWRRPDLPSTALWVGFFQRPCQQPSIVSEVCVER